MSKEFLFSTKLERTSFLIALGAANESYAGVCGDRSLFCIFIKLFEILFLQLSN